MVCLAILLAASLTAMSWGWWLRRFRLLPPDTHRHPHGYTVRLSGLLNNCLWSVSVTKMVGELCEDEKRQGCPTG